MDYEGWQKELAPYLRRWGDDIDVRWSALLTRLRSGDTVTGEVIVKAHFGAWVDIGVDFPALIEIPYIRGLTPERYRADDWCPVGSAITARVLGFTQNLHQVRLAQVRQLWSTITPDERNRLESLVAGLRSISDVLERLGTPSQDLPKGRIAFDPSTSTRRSQGVLIYDTLSDSARVFVVDRPGESPEVEFRIKHIGEIELD
jgi:predicted RNA-binding protein with RPS1 domain